MSDLIIKNLGKAFDGSTVLDGIDLEVKSGDLLVVLGPSGCGKSTLLRLIAGLEQPDKGEIHLGDKRLDLLPPQRRKVAMVFQNYSLYPHMTVFKNMAFPLKLAGIGSSETRLRVEQTAELLGLSDKLDSRPGALSGGQRQRVALGRAIIRKPALFLLDEPLSNLDAELRTRMRREIVRIQRQLGVTTIHVTHDQSEAMTMGDRIAVLDNGRLQQVGPPRQLYDRPESILVAGFLGSPKINVIEAELTEDGLKILGQQLNLPGGVMEPGKVLVGIRPDNIRLDPNGSFRAVLTGVEFLGDQWVLQLDCDQRPIRATLPGTTTPPANGATVSFSVEEDRVMFFDPINRVRIDLSGSI